MAIDYKSPIVILWNTDSSGNPVSEEILNESKQVVQNTIVLTQIPDKFYRVLITGFVEIEQHEEITSETQFKVNYQNGIITFHPSQEGQTINIDKYFGRGVIFTPASRIYTGVDSSGNITQTLYDIIELVKSAIDDLEELDTVVSNAQSIIDNTKYIGEYNGLLSYKKNNTVSLNGYSYLAFQDVPVGVSPPTPPTISNDYWGMVSAKGDKGDDGDKGEKGDKGDKGVNWKGEYSSVVNYIADDVVENAGSSWICISPTVGNPPPTLPTTSNTWWELFAQKGLDGEGSGDMLKSVYDSNSDGKVDKADVADTLTNMQSSVANIDNAVEKTHEHSNKTVIDKFTEVGGELLYDSNPVGEVTQDDLDALAGVGRTTETVKGNADAISSHLAENASKHIAESGTNANGRYIKFDDGTMICFANLLNYSAPTALSEYITQAVEDNTYGANRSLKFADQPFPATFVGGIVYGGFFGGLARDAVLVVGHAHCVNNTSWQRIGITFLNSSTHSTFATKFTLFAIGRWK